MTTGTIETPTQATTDGRRRLALPSAAVRWAYLPVMLLGVGGAGVALLAAGASPAWLFGLFAAALALSATAERLLPYRPSWNRSRGDLGRDIAHAAVNETLNVASVAALPLMAGHLTLVAAWPRHWPLGLQLLAACVVFDVGIALAHVASHRFAPLWRLHAVHHSVGRLYGLNGLMKHPLHQFVEMAAGVTPLVLVGLPFEVACLLALATAVQLLLQHSNADYAVGPLRWILALNATHRFHHLRDPREGDVNFGLFTHLVDHLLGTFRFDPRRRFSSRDLGMADRPDYPVAYLAQLIEPFRRSRA